MPNAYSIFEVNQFPLLDLGKAIFPPTQRSLIEGVEAGETKFTLQRKTQQLEVFRVLHEILEKRAGRAKGVEFTEFIAPYHFPAYYIRSRGVFMLKTRKEIARSAMKTILEGCNDVHGELKKKIDLSSVRERIERFKGVWFSVPDSPDISSQAFFGPSVDRDFRFDQASEEGQIINIRMEHAFAGEYFHVGISDDYSMVIFDGGLDEASELELVMDIKVNLLDLAKVKE